MMGRMTAMTRWLAAGLAASTLLGCGQLPAPMAAPALTVQGSSELVGKAKLISDQGGALTRTTRP